MHLHESGTAQKRTSIGWVAFAKRVELDNVEVYALRLTHRISRINKVEKRFIMEQNSSSCGSTSCESCGSTSCSAETQQQHQQQVDEHQQLRSRLSKIQRVIIVMSGKGGVGKSTVAVNLAMAAMRTGLSVGLLDVDLHGPSVPVMLGLQGKRIEQGATGILPVQLGGLKVLSVGFLLQSPDDPVIWRGPMKMGVIRQFLADVDWGELDLLVVDAPPGTGDEPLSIVELIPELDGAVIVTTPQKVAAADVRKSITFCKQLEVPILGVVENMSGFACPHCGTVTPILRTQGGRQMAEEMHVPFLGSIPMDPLIAESGDAGVAFVEYAQTTPATKVFLEMAHVILQQT